MDRAGIGCRELVERLGRHPAAGLGIDLAAADGPGAWFVAACVLAERSPRAAATAAVKSLSGAGLAQPGALAAAGAARLQAVLDAAEHPSAEALAHRLVRAATRLGERHPGGFDALAAGCDDLDGLGSAVTALASGVGRGTVLRFLRPFRERWNAAADLPLEPAALAAAIHLGWLSDSQDAEGALNPLRARLAEAEDAPPLVDVEAALSHLGTRACRRESPARCPLPDHCPLR